jgi:hypothetical protein
VLSKYFDNTNYDPCPIMDRLRAVPGRLKP